MGCSYDASFTPPFPMLRVGLRAVDGDASLLLLPALIDSGADGTLIPLDLLQSVQASEIYAARLRSHWGEARLVKVYLVDLEIDGHLLPSVDVVADERGTVILLGRNILNKLVLLLDGPDNQTEVLEQRPTRI